LPFAAVAASGNAEAVLVGRVDQRCVAVCRSYGDEDEEENEEDENRDSLCTTVMGYVENNGLTSSSAGGAGAITWTGTVKEVPLETVGDFALSTVKNFVGGFSWY